MTRMRSTRVRQTAAAVAGLALVTVTGCGQNSPGVAAYVAGQEITDSELSAAVAGLNEAVGQENPVGRQDVITAMVLGEVSAQIATRKNIAITDAEREAQTNPALLRFPEARAVAFDLADSVIVQEKLGPEAFLAEVKATPVTVNPRYGVWKPEATEGSILEGAAGSLSRAAAPNS